MLCIYKYVKSWLTYIWGSVWDNGNGWYRGNPGSHEIVWAPHKWISVYQNL